MACFWSAIVLWIVFGASVSLAALPDATGWQVVTIEGRALPEQIRRAPGLVVLRSHAGQLDPVPFQIDERDPAGNFVLPYGSEAAGDEAPGKFDDNDLLVLSAMDAGDRASIADAVEIEVVDPLTGGSGWFYLQSGYNGALGTRDDVDYIPADDLVRAQRYALQFGRNTPMSFAFSGAKEQAGRNLLDRVKARVKAGVLWGLLSFRKSEQDLVSTVTGWKDGPVRVIRRARIDLELGYGLPAMSFTAEDFFTADTFEGPVVVRLPFDLRYVFGDLNVRIFLDFDALKGYQVFAAGMPATAIDCGAPIGSTPDVTADWFGMTGPDGTFIHALRFSPELRTVHRRLLMMADDAPDPPERVAGNCPGIGYVLTEWGGIGRGTHHIGMVIRAFETYHPGDERAFLAGLDTPLQTRVTDAHLQTGTTTSSRAALPHE